MLKLPGGFLLGAATSSHQVEGDNDGNDWWEWERRPGYIHDGSRSGSACEWWRGRAESDLGLAASLGHNAHRMSLEWSRLEPEPGRYDVEAFARYRAILEHGRERGLVLMVTLNHFTLPLWASALGGWRHPSLSERFAKLASACAVRLGNAAPLFATLNEPSVLAFMGYAGSEWPPGLGDPAAGFSALRHMLAAHAAAYHAFKRARPSATVGIVLNAPRFEACRPEVRRDRMTAAAQDWGFTGVVLRALKTGWLLPPLSGMPRRDASLTGAADFVGLNYYGRYKVRFDPRAAEMFFGRHVQQPTVRTNWTDWGEPWPDGLRKQLLRFAELGLPLYVTENGVYDNTDQLRPGYLLDHLRAVRRAIDDGADVRGYFHWSLIDNFEWAEGWRTHFGLVELDRDTQARKPRESARIYEQVCRAGGIPDALDDVRLPPARAERS